MWTVISRASPLALDENTDDSSENVEPPPGNKLIRLIFIVNKLYVTSILS
jgi:hypothetical protein